MMCYFANQLHNSRPETKIICLFELPSGTETTLVVEPMTRVSGNNSDQKAFKQLELARSICQ